MLECWTRGWVWGVGSELWEDVLLLITKLILGEVYHFDEAE